MKKEEADSKTLKQLIRFVLTKLIKQGVRCVNGVAGMCKYSDDKGNHCAVGWILDESNEILMKHGGGLYELLEEHADVLPDTLIENERVWTKIQELHDEDRKRAETLAEARETYPELFKSRRWDEYVKMGANA